MAFDDKEQAIIRAGLQSGKTKDEVREALTNYRLGSPAGSLAQEAPEVGKPLDMAKGALKFAGREVFDTASLLQDAGQGILAGITPGMSLEEVRNKTGIKQLDDEQLRQLLDAKNQGEQIGGNLALGGTLGLGGFSLLRPALQRGARGIGDMLSRLRRPSSTAPATQTGVGEVAETVNDTNLGTGFIQQAKEFGARIPRAIKNKQKSLRESAQRAERLKTATPATRNAIESGLDESLIDDILLNDTVTLQAKKQMLELAQKPTRKQTVSTRPSAVAGEAAAKQYDLIDNQRKAIGKQLEEAIDALPDAKVTMTPAYQQVDDVLRANGIKIADDGELVFTDTSYGEATRNAIRDLYKKTKEAGDVVDAKVVHAKDRMFSTMKRENAKVQNLDDIFINVNGERTSIYDAFRDIYRNALDNLDAGRIRGINKQYATYRTVVDELDNTIFRTAKTLADLDPSQSAAVNLRRVGGDALSTPQFQQAAQQLDDMARQLGYEGADPAELIRFSEDLKKIYPETTSFAGLPGSIKTGIADIAVDALNAGKPQLRDQQESLQKLIEELLTAQ